MTDEEFIPFKGKSKGTWCAWVARKNGRLLYHFPVDSGFASLLFEYEITKEHLFALQTDEERFYLLFAVMHDTHQLAPKPTATMCAEIFDTVLLAENCMLSEFLADADGSLRTLGVHCNIWELADKLMLA